MLDRINKSDIISLSTDRTNQNIVHCFSMKSELHTWMHVNMKLQELTQLVMS